MIDKNILQRPFPYTFFNATMGLIVINVALYMLNYLSRGQVGDYLILQPNFLSLGYFWQPLTYMFMHDPTNWNHILLNMFGLFMFGLQLEKRMGSWEFLTYYLLTGILVGIASILFIGNGAALLGASGAIYAVLLAFATFFPDTRILLFFVLPLRAPIAVLLFAGISLFMQFFDRTSRIAHYAHLLGIVFGFLYFIVRFRINPLKVFFPRR